MDSLNPLVIEAAFRQREFKQEMKRMLESLNPLSIEAAFRPYLCIYPSLRNLTYPFGKINLFFISYTSFSPIFVRKLLFFNLCANNWFVFYCFLYI